MAAAIPHHLSSPEKSFSPQEFNMTEVVITGFGAFTPLGVDAPSTWEAMLAGRSGVHTLPYDWAKPLPVTFAAEAAGTKRHVRALCSLSPSLMSSTRMSRLMATSILRSVSDWAAAP